MKDKQLNVRIGFVLYERLVGWCREHDESQGDVVRRLLRGMLECPGRPEEGTTGVARPVGLPAVHSGSQAERAEYARSLVGRVVRCEHGLVLESCDVCSDRV